MNSLRDLPSVEQLLQNAPHLIEAFGRPLTLDALRETLDDARARFKTDPETVLPSTDLILAGAESRLAAWTRPTLQPVINATGVILHTNLGRAPLSNATIQALTEAALFEGMAPVLVVLGHICSYEMQELAPLAGELGIAVIGGGHCHEEFSRVVNGVALIEAVGNLTHYARVDLTVDTATDAVTEIKARVYRNAGGKADTEVQAIVAGWRVQTDEALDHVIGYVQQAIPQHSDAMYNLVTDAWLPQVNGVVRTLGSTIREIEAAGHEVTVISPAEFRTIPCPTYPEIRLALFAGRAVRRRLEALDPDAVHVSTEGPLGLAARNWCVRRGRPFTTAYHTQFPEYVRARAPIPLSFGYAAVRWFHGRATARGQALYVSIGYGVGGTAGSLLAAWLWSEFGASAAFLSSSVAALAGWLAVRRAREHDSAQRAGERAA